MCGFNLKPFERGAVVCHRDFVTVAAIKELEYAFGQAPAREFAQVGDVVGAQGRVGHTHCTPRRSNNNIN